jgi:hypothetical protein
MSKIKRLEEVSQAVAEKEKTKEFEQKKELAKAGAGDNGKSTKMIAIVATSSVIVLGGVTAGVIWALSKDGTPPDTSSGSPVLPLPPVPSN